MIQKRGARWRVVVQGRRDELTGKRRQLSGAVDTKRQAVELERTFRLQVERGLTTRLTVRDLEQASLSGSRRFATRPPTRPPWTGSSSATPRHPRTGTAPRWMRFSAYLSLIRECHERTHVSS
jgi:hypothetical protein